MESANTVSHIGLWVAVIAVGAFLTWSAVNKHSEDNAYHSGSVDGSTTITRNPLSIDLFDLHCDYIKPDGKPLRPGEKK